MMLRSRVPLFAPLVATLALGCSSAPAAPPASPVAGPEMAHPPAPAASVEGDINHVLDELHDAAAKADEARYFALYRDDAVFLGTDAKERWDLAALRAYAHPRFSLGHGWTFHSVRRAITVAAPHLAYFDEDLEGAKMGPARGSGVLIEKDGTWKVAQYNLSFVVPNERFEEVHALLGAPVAQPKAPVAPYKDRAREAYARGTAAAVRGDFKAAAVELSSNLGEAESMDGSDAAFWIHNQLTWVRWADGDLEGALREVDLAKSSLAKTHVPEEQAAKDGLHEKWDRAYLLLELANAAPATLRAKAVAEARAARADYERAATPLGDHDGMAVLSAFFALRAGDGQGAVKAAKQVDAEKDGDVQDLYVLSLAFDAAGDHKRAEALRQKIRNGEEHLMRPLIIHELERDAKRGRR